MDLQQWRATGRDVLDLGAETGLGELDGQSGRVYQGGGYIELQVDGSWYLQISRDEFTGTLDDLEPHLFAWCKQEQFW